ncbi:flagellar assembly peptidoglycan hydrolase FlgJ [Sinimarinibacterium thermocellulolyticum]|uniref:Peptidoglycan hydrolase FlgJ n=1 Tax=Sinimarinibacterium thermocellulolyticum TaxID=3170016 RepID=A0ABV2AA43_9GAMM
MRSAAVTDFSQYAQLRAQARSDDPAALRATAKQFEALLLQQMLKSMRAASLGDDVLGGEQTQFYQEMFDQQIAQHLAAGRGLGIADLMIRQMQNGDVSRQTSDVRRDPVSTLAPLPRASESSVSPSSQALANAASVDAAPLASHGSRLTPHEFVRSILPYAEKAAAELGIPARVLVAQAALETGWGQQMMRRADGRPAFNYFGIKADTRWQGEKVQTMTREFENGEMRRRSAEFRAYDSRAAAFDDYVRFLKSNPRYAQALRHGGDAARFTSGLQKAGYATDPAYARKIQHIADGQTMKAALQAARPVRLIQT